MTETFTYTKSLTAAEWELIREALQVYVNRSSSCARRAKSPTRKAFRKADADRALALAVKLAAK